jgi:replicative DNA helicase
VTPLTTYIETVYREAEGHAVVGIGTDPYVDAKGKYRHRSWSESAFTLPTERDQLARAIMQASDSGCDAYLCPYAMTSTKRRRGEAVARFVVHADCDGTVDTAKVAQLDGFAVSSGTQGHGHVYVPLSESVSASWHRALCMGLRDHFAGDDKISDNDLLRPPSTLNHKGPAHGSGPATPVDFLVEPSGATVEPRELARRLGVNLPPSSDVPGKNSRRPTAAAVDLTKLPQSVRDALTADSGDRSADTMTVVRASYDSGRTLAQTRSIVGSRDDLAERLRARNDDDVLTCWLKVADTRAERRAVSGYLSEIDAADADLPVPLVPVSPSVDFPVTALPAAYADMVVALAEATQTDPAMAAVSCLSVLAAAAGGRAEVEPRRGWREPLCLFTATVARPGERKSAVQLTMCRPLLDVEQELAETGAAKRVEAETLKAIALKDADRARAAASAATDAAKRRALQADAISMANLAETLDVPTIPRIVADDVTPEAAGSLLADQGGRLAIISAEGGILEIIGGRYSGNVPNLDLWLKGHAGDPLKGDRKGRPPEYIKRPALTVGLMIQHQVLTSIGKSEAFRGRGLLARFLYSEPISKVGHRKAGADPVPHEVSERYRVAVSELVTGLAGWGSDPAVIVLTPEAVEEVVSLEETIEPTLAGNGELAALADWGSKLVGAVLRIAALLHLAQHGHEGVKVPISRETLLSGMRVGHYFKAHAVAAFSTMKTDAATADAVYLLAALGKLDVTQVSRRDAHYLTRARFRKVNDLDPALQRLVEHGYLTRLPDPESKSPGRKPSPMFAIHAHARRTD